MLRPTQFALGMVAALVAAAVTYFVFRDREARLPPVNPPQQGGEKQAAPPVAAQKPDATRQADPPKPLLKDWEKPALAVVLSGEQHGYFEPCGCALIQLGGVSRRDDLLRQIRDERNWPVAALDVGGLVNRKFTSRRQTKLKFETTVDALKKMNYAALALGPEELRLGAESLLQHKPAKPDDLALLSSNVVLFGTPELGVPLPKTVLTVDGVKLGITAVYGAALKGEVLAADAKPQGQAGDIEIGDPLAALKKVVPELEAEQPDLLVLLSHATFEETQTYAKEFPQFDLILTAGGPEDPDPKPLYSGKTLIVTVGAKGKHVGVVGYYPQNSESRFRYELVDLDGDRFKSSPRMEELMRYYQERLKDQNIAATDPAIGHPTGADFVGAKTCGECHKKAYEVWKTTKHANAAESLKTGRKGQEKTWISRIFDAECLSCHVTGWHPQNILRYESGYVDEQKSPHLLGQQCENCHGPGSRHVQLEEEFLARKGTEPTGEMRAARKLRRLTLDKANRLCIECHDLDNSPGYDFDKYWAGIEHPGKD